MRRSSGCKAVVLGIILLAGIAGDCAAGFNLGLAGAVKRKGRQLDNKVAAENTRRMALTYTVTGNVMFGPVVDARVAFYFLNSDGSKGALLGAVQTDSHGAYKIILAPEHASPVLAEATGGRYMNEITSIIIGMGPSVGASAVFNQGTPVVALNTLTHMAARRAITMIRQGVPVETAVDAANTGVSQQYNLSDILRTLPVAINDGVSVATSFREERLYGLVLAAVEREATDLGIPAVHLAQALAEDASDGTLDGMNGSTVVALPNTGGIPLSPTAGTKGLQDSLHGKVMRAPYNRAKLQMPSIPAGPPLQAVSLGVNHAGDLYVRTAALPVWIEGNNGTATLGARGGIPPYAWSVKTGSTLPSGLSLSSGGVISGSASLLASGTTMSVSGPFTVVVTDSSPSPQTREQAYYLVTVKAPPSLSGSITYNGCAAGQNCRPSTVLSPTGGVPPYYYRSGPNMRNWERSDVFSSAIRTAVATTSCDNITDYDFVMDASANISGVPNVDGTATFCVCVVDSLGASDCTTGYMTISVPSPSGGVVGASSCSGGTYTLYMTGTFTNGPDPEDTSTFNESISITMPDGYYSQGSIQPTSNNLTVTSGGVTLTANMNISSSGAYTYSFDMTDGGSFHTTYNMTGQITVTGNCFVSMTGNWTMSHSGGASGYGTLSLQRQ